MLTVLEGGIVGKNRHGRKRTKTLDDLMKEGTYEGMTRLAEIGRRWRGDIKPSEQENIHRTNEITDSAKCVT